MIQKVEGLVKIQIKQVDLIAGIDGWGKKDTVCFISEVSKSRTTLKETMLLNKKCV